MEVFEMCKDTNDNSCSVKSNLITSSTMFSERHKNNPKTVDSGIKSILDRVSTDNLRQYVAGLSDFHTRHSKSPLLDEVGNWIMTQFKGLGYNDTFYHSFEATMDNEKFTLRNIICNKKGLNEKLIIVCAHYDCIMECEEDSKSRAPGANDNASGVSAIMEIARVLAKERLQHSVQFVLFSGEEQQLLGSESYARFIKDNKIDLYRLINLDMIGYPFFSPDTIIIERDNNKDPKHNRDKKNDVESIEFGEIIKDLASEVGLKYRLDSIYDSDYEPFEENGYVVIGAYDGSAVKEKNPHYHSSSDLPEFINWKYLTSVTKLVLATILKVSKK